MTLRDIGTIYSAVIASAAAILALRNHRWDKEKWHWSHKAHLSMSAGGGQVSGKAYNIESKQFINAGEVISVSVDNIGLQTTTVKGFGVEVYDDPRAAKAGHIRLWHRLELESREPSSQKLPYELKSGQSWTGIFSQPPMLREKYRQCPIFIVLYDSTSEKRLSVRFIWEGLQQDCDMANERFVKRHGCPAPK
jgi:hypothetical protein